MAFPGFAENFSDKNTGFVRQLSFLYELLTRDADRHLF